MRGISAFDLGRTGGIFNFTGTIMYNRISAFKNFIEWKAFGVCSAIGERLGVSTSRIRLWFIYISFMTLGSPLIVYMILAFWLNMKRYIWMSRRNPLRWL